ncbi:hypothetical protein MACH26_10860 [Planctobacterium marinum]|uniref:HTH araC/xylS-type domain-containing protein n=2 Tax=Planctobacterium marinum TaxID=1631968 RepID=A0AA48I447_9ALTE|nr:hypothetical protein MACH26_10860 [Planctobacterium marinum]
MLSLGFILWLIPLVLIWVRYDNMPHASNVLFAILLLPFVMLDEILRFSGLLPEFPFLIGVFQFIPVLLAAQVYLAMHNMLIEKPVHNKWVHKAIATFFFVAQVPFLLFSDEAKVALFSNPPMGAIADNWPFYVYYMFINFAILIYALKIDDMVKEYDFHLSDQVVDITQYELPETMKLFSGLVSISFGAILLVIVTALNLIQFSYWQGIISLLHFGIFYVIILLLLQRRRYSPCPIDAEDLSDRTYSEEEMRLTLAKAERAIIRNKLYKALGLRLRTLADLAEIEPKDLAVATRSILNRNFRAYMYHYRLEYAKKIILRSDIKISAIAKRLGFTSEKVLSEMFVKYVQNMASDDALSQEEHDRLMHRKN